MGGADGSSAADTTPARDNVYSTIKDRTLAAGPPDKSGVRTLAPPPPGDPTELVLVRSFVYGLDYIDEVVAHIMPAPATGETTPARRWVLQDANYNVVGIARHCDKQLIRQFRYGAYGDFERQDLAGDITGIEGFDSAGNPVSLTPADSASAQAFQGLWYDAETGLYWMRGRPYDPVTGRFLSNDPNEQALIVANLLARNAQTPAAFASLSASGQYGDGMNLYLGFGGNPVNRTDPSGLFFGGLVETLTTASSSAYARAAAFGAAHPLIAKAIGALIAAADLYGFIQYEEVQAAVAANPNIIGVFQAQIGIARQALGHVLKGASYLKWLAKNSPTAAAKVNSAVSTARVAMQSLGASRQVRFAQKAISRIFTGHPKFEGQEITQVADMLRRGAALADDLPIEVVVLDGVTYTVNNRSLYALRLAGKEPTRIMDVSGDAQKVKAVVDRLDEMARFGLDDSPGFVPLIRGGP